ncbi:hypothetical protein [Rhizobium sp. G21]|uniref:hypothetical protein n=1 Tax=Rhizobium sp. G21 TaxID=2758439 RepID=UPI001603C14B|nr:hypothetical protein [Rhizobium sp. G21]MBB1248338.1 hypothetical protein [Rhizobium sp. G21]
MDQMNRSLLPDTLRARSQALAAHPAFHHVARAGAQGLIAMYDQHPALVRLIGNHQKWLLTGLIYGAYLKSIAPGAARPFCAAQVIEDADAAGILSRNTVQQTMDAMAGYGLLDRTDHADDGRVVLLGIPDHIHGSTRGWLAMHCQALDGLDGGDRAARFVSRPELFAAIHRGLMAGLTLPGGWRDPPEDVALFYDARHGFLLAEHLAATAEAEGSRFWVAGLTRSGVSRRYGIGRSTVHRLFQAAEARGLFSLGDGGVTVSSGFMASYAGWQALKFAALDLAVERAFSGDA